MNKISETLKWMEKNALNSNEPKRIATVVVPIYENDEVVAYKSCECIIVRENIVDQRNKDLKSYDIKLYNDEKETVYVNVREIFLNSISGIDGVISAHKKNMLILKRGVENLNSYEKEIKEAEIVNKINEYVKFNPDEDIEKKYDPKPKVHRLDFSELNKKYF